LALDERPDPERHPKATERLTAPGEPGDFPCW
jgi:hypothetical protein